MDSTISDIPIEALTLENDDWFEVEQGSVSKKVRHSLLAGGIGPGICQGRLTTESGVPISTSDRVAQTFIHFTAFKGNRVSIYDPVALKWNGFTLLAEIYLELTGLTADKNYDVFLFDDGGTLTMELSAPWTDDFTRADLLFLQEGVPVKEADLSRRWVGMIRATGTDTTEDSALHRYVWNFYNQVQRRLSKVDTADDHTYGSGTIREWNGGTGGPHSVDFVSGDDQAFVVASWADIIGKDGTLGGYCYIGLNSLTAGSDIATFNLPAIQARCPMPGVIQGVAGLNRLSMLEMATDDSSFLSYLINLMIWA